VTLFAALITSVNETEVATLFVVSPDSQFNAVGSPHDETRAAGGSWSWPAAPALTRATPPPPPPTPTPKGRHRGHSEVGHGNVDGG
jgi:hypothetical protein